MPPPTPGPTLRTMPLDSPLLAEVRGNGREARSPGIATLKEAFDITYAVHRMEEEGARKRAAKGGANRGFLGGLNEEDEDSSNDEDADVVMEAKKRHAVDGRIDGRSSRSQQPQVPAGAGSKVTAKRALQGGAQPRAHAPRAGATKKIGSSPFELDMDNATLLGRRHKRGGAGNQFDGSPLAQQSPAVQRSLPEDPGSPMRVD